MLLKNIETLLLSHKVMTDTKKNKNIKQKSLQNQNCITLYVIHFCNNDIFSLSCFSRVVEDF